MKKFLSFLCLTFFAFTSCVTMADYNYKNIDRAIGEERFEDVYRELENPDGKIYTDKDSVLENLDKGLISHYSGEYGRSNEELSLAEKLMERYSAKSISQAVTSAFVNDTIIDYSGDPYEDIYTNIIMAFNYLNLEKFDDAFVEVRRFDNKLKDITRKLQVQIENQRKQLKENERSVPQSSMKFHNSALARYLSMLLYRSEGDLSNAQVDFNGMKECFAFQKDIYDFAFPEDVEEELHVGAKEARLNVIALGGKCPLKKEEKTELFAVNGFYKIAMPSLYTRDSLISGAIIDIRNVETNEKYVKKLSHIESIEKIAMATWEQKYSSIVGKTVLRMVAKLAPGIALDVAAKETDNALFSLLGLVAKVSAFASERADVRCSRFFPSDVYAGGITVPQGVYDVSVTFVNSSGKPVQNFVYSNQEIKNGKLNFLESVCLK